MSDLPLDGAAESTTVPGVSAERWSRPVSIVSLCIAVLGILYWLITPRGARLLLLLAGAVLLLSRRRAAWHLHIAYGAAGVLLGLWNLWHVLSGSYSSWPRALYAAALSASLLAMVYPVFVLCWFLRPKIRDDVQSWVKLP